MLQSIQFHFPTKLASSPRSVSKFRTFPLVDFQPIMSVLNFLKQRKLLSATTNGIEQLIAQKKPIYAGFDPTSDGLHVGNLLVLQTLKRF